MFNDTKVDKLRFRYVKKNIKLEDRYDIKEGFYKYYPDNITSAKASYIHHTITPTKLLRDNPELQHNLQMPTQHKLLYAFNDIIMHKINLQREFVATMMHLAKDIVLPNPVRDYILMLNNKSYVRLEKELKLSNNSPSLYLHYKCKSHLRKSYKFVIKFYDKAQEFFNQHGHYDCPIYEPLTPNELALVGNAYDDVTQTLDLSQLNILRIEIEFHESPKIMPITQTLSPEATQLTMPMIINALREGTFYDTLDEVFNRTLKKHVFNADKTYETTMVKLSKVRLLACKLYHESSLTSHYRAIAEDSGLTSQFSEIDKITRKVTPDSELYKELYNTLFPSIPDDVQEGKEVEEEKSARCCNTYNLRQFKHFTLIYEVYIWDDS